MTQVIKKQEWKGFFDQISYDFLDWETSVQIMSDVIGARVLSDGLPFNGITYDDKQGHDQMDLAVGAKVAFRQTHSIEHPLRVIYEPAKRGSGGTLDIEDASGTKTLIEFRHRPRPTQMLVEYVRSEVLIDA